MSIASARALVPSPTMFDLQMDTGDLIEASCTARMMLDVRTHIGTSEERWFAYSVGGGEYANCLVLADEGNPTLEGVSAVHAWKEVQSFRLRARMHGTILLKMGRFDDARVVRAVFSYTMHALQRPPYVHLGLPHPSPASV